MSNQGQVLRREACKSCQALGRDSKGDNKVVYTDGHSYCFSCNILVSSGLRVQEQTADAMRALGLNTGADLITEAYKRLEGKEEIEEFVGVYEAISERGLSKETCEKAGISTGLIHGKKVYCFEYDEDIKLRSADEKKFWWHEGKAKECKLFNLNRCLEVDKPLIITEGEFDAAALVEAGYQACSIKNGAGDALKNIQQDIKILNEFKELWLWLDNDEVGKQSLNTVLEALPKHRIKWIETEKAKDANEALLAGNIHEIITKDLKFYIPEGLIEAANIDFKVLQDKQIKYLDIGYLPKTNELVRGGLEYGTLTLLLAGVGSGKTTLLSHLGYYLYMNNPSVKIANLFYEEDEEITPLRYIGIHNKIPVGALRKNPSLLTEAQWKESNELFKQNNRLMFFGKKCKRDSEGLFDYLQYLVNVLQYNVILIDHISYIIGRTGVSKHGERRDIDELVYKLQDFSIKNKCIIIAVSHITAKQGDKASKNWDDGEIPSVYSGRGSGALAQIPDVVIAMARNTKNPYSSCCVNLYVVKNRWGGYIGQTDQLIYDDETGHYGRIE